MLIREFEFTPYAYSQKNWQEHDFDTLAGFVLHELERIPSTGDKLEWKGFKIEVVDMDGHRIDKVLVSLSDKLKEEIEE